MSERIPTVESSFDDKRRRFFSRAALQFKDAFRVHKLDRLWERNAKGVKDWRNVSEHCLVEAMRVQVIADMVGLSSREADELRMAAALHDANKRLEIEAMKGAEAKGESSLAASVEVDAKKAKQLRESGFGERVARIAGLGGVSPNELFIAQDILNREDLTGEDIACLIMHYVDGYTRGSDWVESVGQDAQGRPQNDVDRRIEKNRNNPAYRRIQVEQTAGLVGHPTLGGKDINAAAGQVLHGIERRLCDIIKARTGKEIPPLTLPEVVDQEIKRKIETL